MNDLQLHLISEHCVACVIPEEDLQEVHDHEHQGPGTIRNHSYFSRSWNGSKVVLVLLEGIQAHLQALAAPPGR